MTYVISDIKTKDGVLREIHREVLGCECDVVSLKVGERGWLRFKPKDPDETFEEYHNLHLSTVIAYSASVDEETVTIETRNTYYVLTKIDGAVDDRTCRL